MDKISGLSDELLVKVLLFLPTKVAVSTSVLSKRWERLWMWLPKLEFDNRFCSPDKSKSLWCFLDRNLPLHKAPVIESLCLKLSVHLKPYDVKLWIVIAIFRHVRELEISYSSYDQNFPNVLPSSLYTCESLVILKLKGNILLDVPRMVCLPSLKTLQLREMVYSNEGCLQRLLSVCPILEDLMVDFCGGEVGDMRNFSIIVPSLQSLSLFIPYDYELDGFVINTPSLMYFKVEDQWDEAHSGLIENMPKLKEAYIDVESGISDIKSLIGSITSVKSLTLCANNYGDLEDVYGDGFVFNQLERLKLCVCQEFDILIRFLKHCPNLRELDYFFIDDHCFGFVTCWKEPAMVPECLVSNIQSFNWSNYLGSQDERSLMVYILKNALCLKKATISSSE